MSIRVGDIVTRNSYGNDIFFTVISLQDDGKVAILQGLEFRLVADAPMDDLKKIDPQTLQKELEKSMVKSQESLRLIQQERRLMREKNTYQQMGYTGRSEENNVTFEIPGSVLHLDGDGRYLEKCLIMYRELGIKVHGFHLMEKDMPTYTARLLQKYQPNILILTGHDSYRRHHGDLASLDSYRNSRYFVQAVQEARRYERNHDRLVIFAGACQSNFESILDAGANFASSPRRINIHTLDPVYIAERVAFTSVRETVNVFEVAKNTITGIDGLGGIETFGTFRLGLPITETMKKEKW
ncbi:sporulation peptidase YabG [Ammoniphilus sp. YIM 78166]|uniref:sporulation peptidase YabG n=1 Tax=Ammoniphilus sp. YIM 78166 TaxID=1644106 RepID=UPI0010701961|nr:sporulation peptidase YabG [Ammoniphilus sp. YIM 78166]